MLSLENLDNLQVSGTLPTKINNPCFFVKNPLWTKCVQHQKFTSKQINGKRFQYIKKGRTFGFETIRYVTIYEGYFFYYDDATDISYKGYCSSENLYVQWLPLKNKKYILYLSNGNESSVFYFNKIDFWYEIKTKLSQKIVQLNFSENYQILEQIGQGSFSKVFLVRHSDSKRLYAAKRVSKFDRQKASTKQIVNEQKKVLSILRSEFVYKFQQFYEEQNHFVFILEYVAGRDLMSVLMENKQLESKKKIVLLKNILIALSDCHALNIIHRDLKPQNIILSPLSFKPKLIDFGLSLLVDKNTQNKQYKRCGTMGYMAPEVVFNTADQRKQYTTKCDIFSFGIIAYIILFGENPLKGKNYEETYEKNKACEINFNKEQITKMYGENCFFFLTKILNPNPKQRLSAVEAYNCVFLNTDEKQLEQSSSTLEQRIKTDLNFKKYDL